MEPKERFHHLGQPDSRLDPEDPALSSTENDELGGLAVESTGRQWALWLADHMQNQLPDLEYVQVEAEPTSMNLSAAVAFSTDGATRDNRSASGAIVSADGASSISATAAAGDPTPMLQAPAPIFRPTDRRVHSGGEWPVVAGNFPPGGREHFDRYGTWIGYTPGPAIPQEAAQDAEQQQIEAMGRRRVRPARTGVSMRWMSTEMHEVD
jgi:hypothetical protein